MTGEVSTIGRRLRIEWLALLGVGALFVAIGTHLVATEVGIAAGRRWLLVAGGVLAYEVGFLGYHIIRSPEDPRPLGDGLGIANGITLVRGVLYAAAAGFLFVPPTTPAIRWAPGICYGSGVVLDYVDGRVARRTDSTTSLGERLDHAFDTLGFLVAPLVGVVWGRLPIAYLSLSAARYLFRAGIGWRRRTGRPVYPLPESRLRRRLAAGHMALIAIALPPVLPIAVVHPVALIALIPSLVVFLRDWFTVSGRLPLREE